MSKKLSRRDFLKLTGTTSVGLALSACGVKATAIPTRTDIPSPTSSPKPSSIPTITQTPTVTATLGPPTLRELTNKLGQEFVIGTNFVVVNTLPAYRKMI